MIRENLKEFDVLEMFPDQESARLYLESRSWSAGVKCPWCGLGERITPRKNGYFRCNQCKEDFTVRTGTILERSHVPLHKWIYALHMLLTSNRKISSTRLSREIGVTQKSAWYVLQRLQEVCDNNPAMLMDVFNNPEVVERGIFAKNARDKTINPLMEMNLTEQGNGQDTYCA